MNENESLEECKRAREILSEFRQTEEVKEFVNIKLIAAIDTACSVLAERIRGLTMATDQWIPCSQRLPREPNHYLVSFSKNSVWQMYWDGAQWIDEDDGELRTDTSAWMELPLPFEEHCL